ncbi:MAG: pantoate--beta-alanine ligase [Ignavibacteriae bacterium]|nr:MAG: pantoate--beta-alanine ligase [Ignavibacteriota bacterium]
MEIVKTPVEWDTIYKTKHLSKMKIGFVPTMGALHNGHLSLIKKSVVENGITVVSIYVNKTQFNDSTDFQKYPNELENDIKLLEAENVNYVFIPTYETMYPDNYSIKISENELSKILCGKSRAGHFEGVLTIVVKLFNIIKPNCAYFGEKDYQQYLLIKKTVEALFMDVKIIPCPIVRAEDGLALSSRNKLLTNEERKKAPLFYKILLSDIGIKEKINKLNTNGFTVDYIEEHFNRIFGAVKLGKVRLIDNGKKQNTT